MTRVRAVNACWSPQRSVDTTDASERHKNPSDESKVEQKQSRRMGCHDRQRRYREKQRAYVEELDSSVNRLRMEVDELLIQRQRIVIDAAQRPPYTSTATSASPIPREIVVGKALAVMRECMWCFTSCSMTQQMQFLQSAMRCDVRHGDLVGFTSILEQWTRLAIYFDDAPFVLENSAFAVDQLESDSAIGRVTAVLVVRVAPTSLAAVFPYALLNDRVQEVLLRSATLRLPMTVHFHFDAQGKVSRYDSVLDFVSGLHSALGNYEDVTNTLQTANIGASGQLGGRSRVSTQQDSEERSTRRTHQQTHSDVDELLDNRLSVNFLLSTREAH